MKIIPIAVKFLLKLLTYAKAYKVKHNQSKKY